MLVFAVTAIVLIFYIKTPGGIKVFVD